MNFALTKCKIRHVSPIRPKMINKTTLDATHNDKIDEFQANRENLPELEKQICDKKSRLNNLNNLENREPDIIKEQLNLQNEINDLEYKILEIKNNQEELDYYLNSGKILFEYYENLEKKVKKGAKKSPTKNTLLNFFNVTDDIKPDDIKLQPKGPRKPRSNTIDRFITMENRFQRATLYDDYLSTIDPNFVNVHNDEESNTADYYCVDCDEYRLLDMAESCFICPKCASSVTVILDNGKSNSKDIPVDLNHFAYKRMNHFNECLSQFQAKESTEIPQEVYDMILLEMKKERNNNLASLTKVKIKYYLKKHSNKNYNKYYEHIPHIINRLNGLPPNTMTPKMEDELRMMFRCIQAPFEKHKPRDRKNFLNYNYVLHKLCQLKGWNDFAQKFPLLKSRDNLYEQETIWKKICKELDWKFKRSI